MSLLFEPRHFSQIPMGSLQGSRQWSSAVHRSSDTSWMSRCKPRRLPPVPIPNSSLLASLLFVQLLLFPHSSRNPCCSGLLWCRSPSKDPLQHRVSMPGKRFFFASLGRVVTSCWEVIYIQCYVLCMCMYIFEGSLEVNLPRIWTDGKAEMGRVREEKKREDQKRERVRRKKMLVREKVRRKVAKDCVFQMFCGSGGSKSRLAKAARANLLGR